MVFVPLFVPFPLLFQGSKFKGQLRYWRILHCWSPPDPHPARLKAWMTLTRTGERRWVNMEDFLNVQKNLETFVQFCWKAFSVWTLNHQFFKAKIEHASRCWGSVQRSIFPYMWGDIYHVLCNFILHSPREGYSERRLAKESWRDVVPSDGEISHRFGIPSGKQTYNIAIEHGHLVRWFTH